MADILIRGISMPKSCLDCNFSNDYGDCCCKDTEPYECEFHKKSRPDWCPLTELPEHGDLIEKQTALAALYSDYAYAAMDIIEKEVPVIIPSNREDAE